MLESRTKEIDGDVYTTSQFPARQGFKLLNRLKKTLGPAIGAWMGEQAENIITLIGADLSDDQMLDLILDFFEFTSVVSKDKETLSGSLKHSTTFDDHFSGRYGRMLKVLAFVLEVNYPDFLTELIPPQMIELGKEMFKEVLGQKLQSISQNESDLTGQSTESGLQDTGT